MDTNNAKNSQTYEFPPSPYGTYFELKTNHFQLEVVAIILLIEIASLSNQEALFSSAKTGFTKPLQLSNIFIIAS